jgi:hypothetical protein
MLHKHTPHNNRITDGLPSSFTAPPYIKSKFFFRKTGFKIAFRPTNIIIQQLTQNLRTITLAGYTNLNVTLTIEPM